MVLVYALLSILLILAILWAGLQVYDVVSTLGQGEGKNRSSSKSSSKPSGGSSTSSKPTGSSSAGSSATTAPMDTSTGIYSPRNFGWMASIDSSGTSGTSGKLEQLKTEAGKGRNR